MRILFLSLFILIADQLSKLFVKGINIPFFGIEWKGMKYAESIEVFGSFLQITFVENPGMAFGIEVGESSKLFLSLFSLFASIGLLVYLYRMKDEKPLFKISIALIIAGAAGNLIDRTFYGLIYGYAPIFYGRVVDFINVDFFDFTIFGRTYERWPIFNIADAAVTGGVILMLMSQNIWEKPVADEESGNNNVDNDNDVNGNTDSVVEKTDDLNGEDNNRAKTEIRDTGREEQGKN